MFIAFCTFCNYVDTCQNSINAAQCRSDGCFWDQYTNSCFVSLSQIVSKFDCAHWSSLFQGDGTNPACQFHGCAYDSTTRTCSDVTQEGSTTNTDTTTFFNSKVEFINPRVLDNSNTFQVFIVTPFEFDTSTTIQPKFPIVNILFPVNSVGSYATKDNRNCSSYNAASTVEPEQYFTNIGDATINSYLQQWVNANSNFNFDNSPNAQVLQKALGQPLIGNSSIIKRVEYDGVSLNYTGLLLCWSCLINIDYCKDFADSAFVLPGSYFFLAFHEQSNLI